MKSVVPKTHDTTKQRPNYQLKAYVDRDLDAAIERAIAGTGTTKSKFVSDACTAWLERRASRSRPGRVSFHSSPVVGAKRGKPLEEAEEQ